MKFLKRNDSGIWVITATEGEFNRTDANICYTGVGKVNAAIAVQKLIDTEFGGGAWASSGQGGLQSVAQSANGGRRPGLVINLSTAGSSSFDFGAIVNCTGFVQRDMNPSEFLAPKYVVPMSDDAPILEYGARDARYPAAVCGSGDEFVRNVSTDIWNCVDMESWAYAYALRASAIPFRCYKFISDGAGENTADHEWLEVLEQAAAELGKVYEGMM